MQRTDEKICRLDDLKISKFYFVMHKMFSEFFSEEKKKLIQLKVVF